MKVTANDQMAETLTERNILCEGINEEDKAVSSYDNGRPELIIPPDDTKCLIEELLAKTIHMISQFYYWPGSAKDAKDIFRLRKERQQGKRFLNKKRSSIKLTTALRLRTVHIGVTESISNRIGKHKKDIVNMMSIFSK